MSSTIPYGVARQTDMNKKKRVDPNAYLLPSGQSAAQASGQAISKFVGGVAERSRAANQPMPEDPDAPLLPEGKSAFRTMFPAPPKRKDEADAIAAGVTPTIDQNKQATAAPPGQGGEAPKESERRPSRDADWPDYGDVDPTSFGSAGHVMVHSTGEPDPATQPGGFAHPGSRTPRPGAGTDSPRFAQGAEVEELGGGATIRRGPKAVTGGHEWTLATPSGQQATYETARYQQAVRGRQAEEDAELAKLDAAAAGAKAELVRSEALQEQPFAPEQAEMAGQIGEEQAKTQPEMARMDVIAGYTKDYQENVGLIQKQLAVGLIDAAEAERLMQDQKTQFIMAMSGMNRTRVPREDPLASFYGGALDDETITQS